MPGPAARITAALATPPRWWTAAVLALTALAAAFVTWLEYDWFFIAPALGSFVSMAGIVFAVSRRWRFSLLSALLLFLTVFIASKAKFALVAMNLHVYDAIFYPTSPAQVEFLFSAYPRIAWAITAALCVVAVALAAAWRVDSPAICGRARLAAAGLSCLVMAVAAAPLAGRNGMFFTENRFIFSAFVSSFADLPQLVRFKGLIEVSAAPAASAQPMDGIVCKPATTPPDIVFFLNESAMPPGVYPSLVYPDELKDFFAGPDGRVRPMRVETFGGGTWLTDFSALTGLSTHSFGSMRNFVANFMTGRLRHSLPQYLAACGYETTMIYPASVGFAGVGRFYEAIGFDRIIDISVHKAPDQRQRDAFYLAEVAKILEANAASARPRPQFLMASSMSTHSPWDYRFAPEAVRETDHLRWNADPEFDEYLWRLVVARRDRDAFRARLAASLPQRRILHVGFGDHQPALARLPLEGAQAIANTGGDWQLDPASKAFETYYRIDGQNFTPAPPQRDYPIVEVAHLATMTVMAAGLPLDPVYARRARLLEQCNGLYATCADRAAVLTFQRWLVDSDWVAQR